MLKKNAQIFEGLFLATDLLVISIAWMLSYVVRFSSGWIPIEKGVPDFTDYLKVLLFIWLIWAFVFRRFGLYRAMRGSSRVRELWFVVKANSFSVLIFLAVTYLFREKSVPFSRLVFAIFWILSTTGLMTSRTLVRQLLRSLRKRGYNRRYMLIVGAGELAAKVVRRMRTHSGIGIEPVGCLSGNVAQRFIPAGNSAQGSAIINGDFPSGRKPAEAAMELRYSVGDGNALRSFSEERNPLRGPAEERDVMRYTAAEIMENPVQRLMVRPDNTTPLPLKILGHYRDLPYILDQGGVDIVVIALPLEDHLELPLVIREIGDSIVDVKIVPDYHQFIRLGSLIEELDGLPVMSLASTPLSGINRIAKRILDIVLGTVFSLVAIPIVGFAALAVRLSSRGPVFYSQDRVGLDGQKFTIFKLRTMFTDAECSGAQFAVKGDPRVTVVGKFLRKFNVDELPQLYNVLRGQMSLVGPRPERPVFIEDFRKEIPRYMLRHKVQAGMTGWAQVNGWRGNTSIERRIEHDLYYIENWSLTLDLKIIAMTFLRSFRDNNAY